MHAAIPATAARRAAWRVAAGDTLRLAAPLVVTQLGYRGVGIPACLALGFPTPLGPDGIWLGMALGLAVAATALSGRFLRLTRLSASRTAG